MERFAKTAAFAGILLAALATDAAAAQPEDAVPARQPVVTELSAEASAMTFWVIEREGWRVVTIVDTVVAHETDAEKHAVVRFSSVLLPGQSQLISVPLARGEQQQVLRISRINDRIRVERVPGV